MGPGIPLVLAALGIIAFATSAKAGTKAGATAPVKKEFQDIPLPLLQEMAKAIQGLTVTDFTSGADGSVSAATIAGPVTKESVQIATALAAKLDQAGFPSAAKTIRDLAKLAGKKIPTPDKDKQIPLPAVCFTSAESDQLNRLVAVERDPKVLQAVLNGLKAKGVPAECAAQVNAFIGMLSALIVQVQAAIDEAEALRKTEEELKGHKTSDTHAKTDPTPKPVNPIIPPVPPGPLPRVVIVKSGDGFARITGRLMNGDQSRWPELRNRNVPQDADGRRRSKDSDAKGGIKPILQPNQKLFVPESWPAMDSTPVNPVQPDAPNPVNPIIPPQPDGVTPKVYIVKSGDGFSRITQNLIGDQSRWPELRDRNVPQDADGRKRAVDTAANGGIKPILQPNQKLFVPENWATSAGIPIGPVIPKPVINQVVAPPTTRVTIVKSGDGFARIAQRLIGDQSRWPELRDRNVPVDADGRSRSVDTAAKGGIKPMLQPNNRLFVPESWPNLMVAGAMVGLSDERSDASNVIEQKTPYEIAAEALVSHLNRLQSKHPGNFSKMRSKLDKRIVARFQKLCGLPIDVKVTPTVLLKAAEHGQVELPLVIDWPEGATLDHVVSYRGVLLSFAQQAAERQDERAVHELTESIKREKGQAAGLTQS